MLFHLSDSVLREVLKLQAIEDGRAGNYTEVDERLDKVRYRVSDLVMGSIMRDVRSLQSKPALGNEK